MTVRCPACQGEIQPTWDWCENCGFDPDGLRPAAVEAPRAAFAGLGAPGSVPGPVVAPGPIETRYGQPGYRPPTWNGPAGGPGPAAYAARPSGSGATAAKVVGGVVVAFVLLMVVCVAAVTLLGHNARPSSVSAASATPALAPTSVPLVWTTWIAADGSFSIDFPGAPSITDLVVTDPKMKKATSALIETKGVMFGVGWYDPLPGYTVTDSTVMLQSVADGAAQGSGWNYTRRELGDFAGNPALFLDGTSSDIRMQGMVMISGARAYLFLAGAEPGRTIDYDGFLATFHIL